MKPVNQRIGKVAQILAIPLMLHTGPPLAWSRFQRQGYGVGFHCLGVLHWVLLSAAVTTRGCQRLEC